MTDTSIDLDWDIERSRDRRNKRWSQFDGETIDLTVAEMDLPVAEPVTAAVTDAVSRQSFGYPLADEQSGVPEAASTWLSEQYGLTVHPEQIRLLPELMRGVTHAIARLTRPGSAVVVPTPCYGRFFDAIVIAEREAREVPLCADGDRYRLDLEGIERELAAGAGAVLLCHPNNPTGAIATPEELAELAVIAERHEARVLSDEVHAPLRYADEFTPFAKVSEVAADRAITLFSATKAWNFPGLRCGLIAFTNPEDSAIWAELPRAAVGGMSPLGMEATIAAFQQGEPWLREAIEFLDGNRTLLRERLAGTGIGYTAPQAGYLAWLDLRRFELAEPAEFLREQAGVAVTAGEDHGAAGTGFVRLNFATPPAVLGEAIDRIRDVLTGPGPDPKDVVRHGYDAVSQHYRADEADEGRYAPWIAELRERVPAHAEILDLGCGCGVPLARSLAQAGHGVTGVDFSEVQLQRARQLVPEATFHLADITATSFPAASFDAIACLYALIHLPLEEQPRLLNRIASWLRPGGWALLTVGHSALTETETDWLGGGAHMWWSQTDEATYESWITEAGLEVVTREFVPEDDSGHTLFWARRS